jgi:hypothetical protein
VIEPFANHPRAPTIMLRVARRHRSVAAVAIVPLLMSCGREPTNVAAERFNAVLFGKAAGLAVTRTAPTAGDQGQTLDVHVYGTGFTPGAVATWALQGVANPAKVRTNSTTFISDTELVANVTIAPDASIAYWDVIVAASGKSGVGTESFEVTSAIVIAPSGGAADVNAFGDVTGYMGTGPTEVHAFGWTPVSVGATSGAISDLGWQRGREIDEEGLTIVGSNATEVGQGQAAYWRRPTRADPWPTSGTRLPDPVGYMSTSSMANAVATVEGVTTAVGNVNTSLGIRPVVWRMIGDSWTAAALPLPPQHPTPGTTRTEAVSITGDAVGHLQPSSGGILPIYWDRQSDGSYIATVLPMPAGHTAGAAYGLDPSTETIAVGVVQAPIKRAFGKDTPVMWRRDGAGVWTATLLPTLTVLGAFGQALGVTVTASGEVRIVGASVSNSTSNAALQPVYWSWPASSAGPTSARPLGGTGTKTDTRAMSISPDGTRAAGEGGGALLWLLP